MSTPREREVKVPTFFRMRELEPRKLERAEGEEGPELYRVALSSEEPVERQDWFGDRWVEILSHAPDAVDMRRFEAGGIAFLRDHDRRQVDGILRDGSIEKDKVLRADLQWSDKGSSQEVKGDVDAGVRPYVSVGYIPHEAEKISEKDGVETWLITRWEPVESSSVSIPADVEVGFGREQPDEELHVCKLRDRTNESGGTREEESTMADPTKTPGKGTEGEARQPANPEPGVHVGEPTQGREKDYAEIARMAAAHGLTDKVPDWIERKLTPDQVSREILEHVRTNGTPQPAAEALQGLSERDRERYSYRKAILQFADGKLDGLEREVHEECAKNLPTGYEEKGGLKVPIRLNPNRAMSRSLNQLRTRAMDSLTAGQGAEVVFDRPGELIELLRAQAFVIMAGARVLSGLTAPVPFQKKTSAPTIYWVGENPGTDVTEGNVGTGLVTLLPKTLQGAVSYSRQLLMIDSIDSEMMVRDELASGHALAIDRGALHGIGANGEPTGIYSAADVQVKAMGGVPTFGKLVDMLGAIANQNAFTGAISWMSTPLMAAKMMQTAEHATATMAGWVWKGTFADGIMAGYPARATNQVSSTLGAGSNEHGIIAGNWTDMNIGLWGVMELVVDPYTKKKQGMIEVASFQMADVILRHGQSFCKATGATLS